MLDNYVEHITGLHVGSDIHSKWSIHNDVNNDGVLCDKRAHVIFSHDDETNSKCTYERAVILVRNPFDVLVSDFQM